MKLLWLDLNSSFSHSSLALPALHAQVQNEESLAHVQWHIVSGTINEQIGALIQKIVAISPDVIAGTLWLFNRDVMLQILGRVNALLPKCIFILGGPEFLGDNRPFLATYPFVDAVFRGEGEEQFSRWLCVYDTRQEWSDIVGLCYRENDFYRDNGIARVLNFDQLKSPEESCFFDVEKPFVQLETSRGCFNTCAFCVSGAEKPVRSLSIVHIEERLNFLHRKGVRHVRVLDRTFNAHPRRATQMIELFLRYSPNISFHLEMHPALLTASLKSLLQQLPAGLLHLEAGIQSLQPDVIAAVERKGGVTKALEGLAFLSTLTNMETHADLIAGLPLYTYFQLVDDVCHLAEMGVGEIQLESLKLLPGTKMRRRAVEWGMAYAPDAPYEVLKTDAISVDELQHSRLLSRMLDNYYNTSHWHEVVREMFANRNFLTSFLDFLIQKSVLETPLSSEKRGLLLYQFCSETYPHHSSQVSIAWLLAGLSLKKQPVEKLRTKHQTPPQDWDVMRGEYDESLKLVCLPAQESLYWFGYEVDTPFKKPVFMARSQAE